MLKQLAGVGILMCAAALGVAACNAVVKPIEPIPPPPAHADEAASMQKELAELRQRIEQLEQKAAGSSSNPMLEQMFGRQKPVQPTLHIQLTHADGTPVTSNMRVVMGIMGTTNWMPAVPDEKGEITLPLGHEGNYQINYVAHAGDDKMVFYTIHNVDMRESRVYQERVICPGAAEIKPGMVHFKLKDIAERSGLVAFRMEAAQMVVGGETWRGYNLGWMALDEKDRVVTNLQSGMHDVPGSGPTTMFRLMVPAGQAWRSEAVLPPGHYRIVAKTSFRSEVTGERGPGAIWDTGGYSGESERVPGAEPLVRNAGNIPTTWGEFDVKAGKSQTVELELEAQRGGVTYD